MKLKINEDNLFYLLSRIEKVAEYLIVIAINKPIHYKYCLDVII